jgi:ATP-dependent helicase/DNAse subunit B
MAIRFILGTSGSGKTRWCIDAIAGALRNGGDEPLVFLVPEQATFQAERAILSCERSEERRVGKECSDSCRSRWSPYH